MRLSSLVFYGLLVVISTTTQSAMAQSKTDIYMFRYNVALDDGNTELEDHRLSEFVKIIRDKLRQLSHAPDVPADLKLELERLKLQKIENSQGDWSVNTLSIEQMHSLWRQRNALGVFDGRIIKDDGVLKARTRVFFGDLNHSLTDDLQIDLLLVDAQYDTTRDSHSAIVLYAMLLAEIGLIGDSKEIDCSNAENGRSLVSLAIVPAMDAAETSVSLVPVRDAITSLGQRLGRECQS